MIIADENIDYRTISALREDGINVQSVYDEYRGISDEEVIESSKNPPKIILTEDKGFGEWVFSHKVERVSVIFLRYRFSETEKMIQILKRLINSRTNFIGYFTTITPSKIRKRKI